MLSRMQGSAQRSTTTSLCCAINWLSLAGLEGPREGWLRTIREAGYDGVQFIEPLDVDLVAAARSCGLKVAGSGRVNAPEDAERLAVEARGAGLACLTVHVGWGYEDDVDAVTLIEAILEASAKHGVPLFVETHRATLFQDMWRAVQFVRRYPDLRFNADFSHWYTGSEMVYGGFEKKLAFIQPVIERARFVHGRIGNPGCMQVDIGRGDGGEPFVDHFRTMWRRVFAAFLQNRKPDEVLWFAAELLGPEICYARTFAGKEESDRWEQSLVLTRIARECFAEAPGEREG